jgi:PRTRC genetic system protein E
MGMFTELYALASDATLTLVIDADAKQRRMTINVVPKPKKDHGEAALSKDLSLTATPEEFDAEFLQVLQGYREQRRGLLEQAQATAEVLAAAKDASAKKGAEAVAKAGSRNAVKRAVPAQTAAVDEADDERDDDTERESAEGDASPAGEAARQEPGASSAGEPQLFG